MLFSFIGTARAQTQYADIYKDAADTPLLTSLIVAQNGKILREAYFHGLKANQAVNVKSVSKSILSAVIGIAVAEGKLKETDRISDLLPNYFTTIRDPVKRRLTVRDFLTMEAGLESTSFDNYGAWVKSRACGHPQSNVMRECVLSGRRCGDYAIGTRDSVSRALALPWLETAADL